MKTFEIKTDETRRNFVIVNYNRFTGRATITHDAMTGEEINARIDDFHDNAGVSILEPGQMYQISGADCWVLRIS